MNILRLTTITLSLTLLAACGGGGGGGGTPAAGGGGMRVQIEELPPIFMPSDAVMVARALTGGILPEEPPSQSDLEMKVVEIAEISDALLFSEMATAPPEINATRMIMCTPGAPMCTAVINDGINDPDMQMQAPKDIEGPVLVENEYLVGWNDTYDIVMTDRGIPLVQMRAAGRDDAGMRFEYQGYGGWLEHSVFVIQEQGTMVDGVRASSLSAYSFGKVTGTNPSANARWDGVMIGSADGNVVQGDAVIQWDAGTPSVVSGFFNKIKNISDEGPHMPSLITLKSITLNDGAFASDDAFVSATGSISGYFYGEDHAEVGGIFNVHGIFGAFGAKK